MKKIRKEAEQAFLDNGLPLMIARQAAKAYTNFIRGGK